MGRDLTASEITRMVEAAVAPRIAQLKAENEVLERAAGFVTPEEYMGTLREASGLFLGPRADKGTSTKAERKARKLAEAVFVAGGRSYRQALREGWRP